MARMAGLQRRVVLAAALSLLVTGTVLVMSLVAWAGTRAAGHELSARLVPAAAAAEGLLSAYASQQGTLRDYVTSGRPAELAAYEAAGSPIPAAEERVAALVLPYPGMPGQLAAAEAAHRAWLAKVAAPQLAAAQGGDFARARAMQADVTATRPYAPAVRARMTALQAQVTSAQARVTARLTAGQAHLLLNLIAVCAVVALTTAGAVAAVRRWLLRPVAMLRQAAAAVAAGRYDTPVPAPGPQEVADLGRAAERMRARLVAALAGARQAEAIIASSHDAVVGKSLDGVITSWNPGAQRLYGYSSEEVIGRRDVALLIPQSDRALEARALAAVARGERVEQYRTRRLRKDHAIVDVSLAMSPITDAGGAITGVATVARDLTGEQRAEARFRGLLEAAPDAMVCVGADGRITLVNVAAERLFGYGRDEMVGQPVELLVPEAVRDQHQGHRARYQTDPRPRPIDAGMQLAGRRRDGTTFPAEVSLSGIDTDEGILVTAAVRDVTGRLEMEAERERMRTRAEREEFERQLHQSQRLESLGQLAGGVAHDFNNLLGVISNYAAFVSEELAAQTGGRWQETRDDVAQIEQAAGRAAGLTRQLLAFARQEVIQPRVLDLNEVVAGVQQLLSRTLGEHIELVTELSDGLEPVLADSGQMEQVLVNLAVNARDAMPGGGKLIISTSAADVGQPVLGYAGQPDLVPGQYIAVKVSDTGTGIPKEVVERIFEPFFSTKPKGEGTGLGLATVYGIISRAGGSVRIYSEPGMGTVFTILLPVAARDVAATPQQATRPLRGHGKTVLLVEDEHAMREVTRRILGRNGYHVTAAASGHDALHAVGTQIEHIDLLLTDVVMPQMQGRELADKILLLRPATRVLFMSGYTQGLLSQQGVLQPGCHLLEKPFTETALLAKVSQVLATAGPA
jgi:two-component system, cell cycle sensor histidine kinase and response regulator CckA